MHYRKLGRTGWDISEVGFGAWAIGGSWGQVDDDESMRTLHHALDRGVNFFDTADVYGDGHSERLIARLRRERSEPFYVATKAGRRLDPHTAAGYNAANLRSSSSAVCGTSRSRRSISCSSTVRRRMCITDRKYSGRWTRW